MYNEKLKIVKGERTEPSLGQILSLKPLLAELYNQGRITVKIEEGVHCEFLYNISLKQYNFILSLRYSKNYTKLNDLLIDIIKRK